MNVIKNIIKIFSTIVSEFDKEYPDANLNSILGCFCGSVIPSVSIEKYIARFCTNFSCSTEVFVYATIYIDRIIDTDNNSCFNSWNFHRIFLAAFVVATKFIDDYYCANSVYAAIGGVSTEELNFLELNFLKILCFDLYVDQETFAKFHNLIVNFRG